MNLGFAETMQLIRTYLALVLPAVTLAIFGLATGDQALANHENVSAFNSRHPVSVVEADIYVTKYKMTVKLKCFAEDLELLQGVEPLEEIKVDGVVVQAGGHYDNGDLKFATQEHAKYLAEKVVIRNAKGEQLKGKVKEITEIDIPDEGIKAGKLMDYTMGFVIEYEYSEQPEFITIEQKMVADGALLPSELKILMKQAGSDAPIMHMMKPSEPETFRFDWDNPMLASDASEEEWNSWFEKQRETNLGITSYSSVYSFVYITNHQVRHEVLIPLATLATLIDIERVDESFLEIAEQEAAAEKIKAYFSVGNPVKIDSVEVQPVFDRVDFYGLELKDFAMQAEKRKVSMASGRVGIIMSYSTKGSPRKVEVTWDKFNTLIKVIDAVIFPYDKIEKTRFSRFLVDNTYVWEEPDREPFPPITQVSSTIDLDAFKPPTVRLPVVSSLLAVCGLMLGLAGLVFQSGWKGPTFITIACLIGAVCTVGIMKRDVVNPFAEKPTFEIEEEEAKQVFLQLHKNMFRAFDYHEESDVYDALANSVDGELLRELYLDLKETLEIKEQGGATSRVDEVNFDEGSKSKLVESETETGSPDDAIGFGYRCKWNLIGSIEHWGHIHQRKNQYDAAFNIQLVDDAWKITAMKVLDFDPTVIKQGPRKF